MNKYQEIRDIISKYENVIIYRHIHSDYDAYGSQLGLKHVLLANCPDLNVYCVGTEDIENPGFLDEMDNPDEETISKALAIIVDCSNAERIEGDSWKRCKYSVRIDHHPYSTRAGAYELVDDSASSACQLIAELAFENNWRINRRAAELLYSGMSTDTVRFTIDKVDGRLFADLSRLKEAGFNVNEINRKVYDIDKKLFGILNTVRSHIMFTGNIAYLYITMEDMTNWELPLRDAKDTVNLMSSIRGVDKYVTFIENDDHTYTVSLRAHKITISDIAEKYGGGGHLLAAGINAVTFEQTREIIEQLVEKK